MGRQRDRRRTVIRPDGLCQGGGHVLEAAPRPMFRRDRAWEPRALSGCRAPADGDRALEAGTGPIASDASNASNASDASDASVPQ